MKSVIKVYKAKGKGLLLTSYNIKTFFDAEDPYDFLNELYNSKVKGKVYRLIYEMNKNSKVRIKTPVGITDTKNTGPILSQGSVEAAILSSNNIGNGMKETFTDKDKEVEYLDNIKLAPLSFLDDLARLSTDRDATQYGNDKVEDLLNRKGLELNLDKSNFLIMGSKKSRKKIQNQVDQNPLTLNNQNMKQVKTLKYLGDFISTNLSESVHDTVMKRIPVAKMAIYEIRAVIEDRRAKSLGGINVGLMIWESMVIPMLYYNSCSWLNTSRKTIKMLNNLYNHWFCCLF